MSSKGLFLRPTVQSDMPRVFSVIRDQLEPGFGVSYATAGRFWQPILTEITESDTDLNIVRSSVVAVQLIAQTVFQIGFHLSTVVPKLA